MSFSDVQSGLQLWAHIRNPLLYSFFFITILTVDIQPNFASSQQCSLQNLWRPLLTPGSISVSASTYFEGLVSIATISLSTIDLRPTFLFGACFHNCAKWLSLPQFLSRFRLTTFSKQISYLVSPFLIHLSSPEYFLASASCLLNPVHLCR
jgi:hypothetical protein